MKFRTEIEIEKIDVHIQPHSKINMLGSCFANHIGERMICSGLDVHVNPFGVLYNPVSIATACAMMVGEYPLTDECFFQSDGMWHCWLNDSSFSVPNFNECKEKIERVCQEERERLKDMDYLFITLGTNRCYELNESRIIVGNCHKQPMKLFAEKTLDVAQIIDVLQHALDILWRANPMLHIVFTVSPYRYAKYGFHDSQLCKASLLLAINELCVKNSNRCVYFPAYEIVLDELRDYRFYASDMLHPSDCAVNYIWERFVEKCFNQETVDFMREWQSLEKSFAHRPLHPESDVYKQFIESTRLKLNMLLEKNPNVKGTLAYARLVNMNKI